MGLDLIGSDQNRSGSLQVVKRLGKDALIGISAGQRNQNTAYGDSDLSTDLEQFQSNGIALGSSHAGALESQAAQLMDQQIGGCRKPES